MPEIFDCRNNKQASMFELERKRRNICEILLFTVRNVRIFEHFWISAY